MARDFEGPVRGKAANGGRSRTVVTATSLVVGAAEGGGPTSGGIGRLWGVPVQAGGEVFVDDDSAREMPTVDVSVGGKGCAGGLHVTDTLDNLPQRAERFGQFGTGVGQAGGLMVRAATNGPVILVSGASGRITFLDDQLHATLELGGRPGDIELSGADCAEDFDVEAGTAPGALLFSTQAGRCERAPTRTTRGSRALCRGRATGGHASGSIATRRRPTPGAVRAPVALAGKVFCLVDTDTAPIDAGDLLTTSATVGHAMRATNRDRSFGAVLGKSLGTLAQGKGLVPVLVALQ
jgi:hypothetical protein